MVEVFKTNVRYRKQAKKLLASLQKIYPDLRINFDLENCDKILRVEGIFVEPRKIVNFLGLHDFYCKALE